MIAKKKKIVIEEEESKERIRVNYWKTVYPR